MQHEMKLQSRYYEYMKRGSKRIELRLYDEKRQKIEIGDTILFLKEPERNEKLLTKVIGLLQYDSFTNLLNDVDISLVADATMTKEELLTILEGFYPKEEQEKYGVIGIRIEIEK